MPSVSIIVPVYQVENFLSQCIDSILAQTYQNFELILVDDGSTDASSTICDEYAAKDPRIRVIHQTNLGLSAARNNGVMCATAKWIMFVDGDDIIHSQMLQLLYEAVQKHHVRLSMCDHIASAEVPDTFYQPVNSQSESYAVSESCFEDLLRNGRNRYWVAWGKLIDKEILYSYPFPVGRIYEDNSVVYRWINAAGAYANYSEAMYFYRQRQNSIIHSNFSYKKLDYLLALEEQIEFYRKLNYEKMLTYISGIYVKACANVYRNLITHLSDVKTARALRKKMLMYIKDNRQYICLTADERKACIQDMFVLLGSVRQFTKKCCKCILGNQR